MRFPTLLREVARGLDAPHPARIRILAELSSDLDDLYEELRAEGYPEGEARRRAAELLEPTAEATDALVHLHRPIWQRLLARFSDRTRNRTERALLGSLTLLVMFGTVMALAERGAFDDPSPYLGAVLALAAAAVVLSLTKILQLYLRGEHDPGRVRAGLSTLLVIACTGIGVAAVGSVVGLASAAARIQADVALQRVIFFEWLGSTVTLTATALLIALVCGIVWLAFVRRAAGMEQAEAEVLGRFRLSDASTQSMKRSVV